VWLWISLSRIILKHIFIFLSIPKKEDILWKYFLFVLFISIDDFADKCKYFLLEKSVVLWAPAQEEQGEM